MILFPAIDLYDGKAVRLYKGNYAEMTVYSEHPEEIASDFIRCGTDHIHIVDLEGAKTGETPNFSSVLAIKERSGAFCEIGGGIRSMEVLERYLSAGIDRAIIGTAAITDERFLKDAINKYGDRIAVGADIRDGFVCIKGWVESSGLNIYDFMSELKKSGIKTVICTDISKDGAMQGTNRLLYKDLQEKYDLDITASGGVSTIDDIKYLSSLSIYGAIIGKAYYTGAIDLKEAAEAVQ